MSELVKGSTIGFLSCPHCGKETEFYIHGNSASVICSDHNCWGGMTCNWGGQDEPYRFIEKMKACWNQRTPSGHSIIAARDYIRKYRDSIQEEIQQGESDFSGCCLDVLDKALNKLECFLPSGNTPATL